jgi:hypothetical protein
MFRQRPTWASRLSQGQTRLTRRQAWEASRLIAAARAGKPVSPQVAAAVTRQDAVILAALNAAARRGQSAPDPASRQEALTDAELAALVRQDLLTRIK